MPTLTSTGDESFDFGALEDAQSPQGSLAMLPPQALVDAPLVAPPARVVLTAVPPVVAQGGTTTHLGSPGTCEAQSFGYGLGSSIASLNASAQPIRNVGLQQNEASRAFLYAKQVHERNIPCGGTLAFWYLNELILNGAASEAQVPYQPDCTYLTQDINTSTEPADAAQFKIAGFSSRKTLVTSLNEVLPVMKAVLAAGFPIAFSGLVPDDYGHLELTDGVYYPQNFVANSGHGQLIIGYDDNIGAPGRKGAFLVQNSFGTQWPFISTNPAGGGRIWYSYEGFFLGQRLVATAYPLSPNASSNAGTVLHTSGANAPRVTVTRSYQWSPDGIRVYFIVHLAFSEPMRLSQIKITENPPTSVSASGGYGLNGGNFLAQNYAFFERSDGNAFLPGRYSLHLETIRTSSQSTNGTTYSYGGNIAIGPPKRFNLPVASMRGVAILDSLLGDAVVT